MFDLFFDNPAYRPVYVISDSEMKELQRTQNQDELEEIRHQKKRLDEAYKAQVKHLDEREKELKTELKAIETAKKKKFMYFIVLDMCGHKRNSSFKIKRNHIFELNL